MLKVIRLSEKDEWDAKISNFENHDVYYKSGYVEAFYLHGDGEPLLFYYEDNEIKAINVVMKRKINISNNTENQVIKYEYYDLSTPYGYGGFLIEGDITDKSIEKMNKLYTQYCVDNNIISEFSRFHPVLNNVKYNDKIYESVNLGKTVTVELKSKTEIWKTLSGKNRNVIRKAKKSGVEIAWGKSKELFERFIPMYNQTMSKDNATNYYYFDQSFYNSLLTDLKYNHLIFYAEYEGEIISMAIIIFANKQVHYHLSASNRDYQHLSATNLLLFEVACWASANGFDTFHLGGGLGSKEDNLFKFKSAFNKNSTTIFSIGKKIFISDKYDEFVNIHLENKLNYPDENFFPLYRSK